MKSMEHKELSCPECGARVASDSEVCELCGSPMRKEETVTERAVSNRTLNKNKAKRHATPRAERHRTARDQDPDSAVFCNQCGHRTVQPVRFCTACGAPLQLTPVKVSASKKKKGPKQKKAREPEPKENINQQVMKLIGVSVVVVVMLYAISVWVQGPSRSSSSTSSSTSTSTGQPGMQPGSIEAMSQALALEESIAAEQDVGVRQLQLQELAGLYIQAGRLDKAGDAQRMLAEIVNTADAWARAGNAYFDWMIQLNGQERTDFAKKCIEAYLQSLELNPNNLSVRTDLGNAYQYDPDNPEEALRHTEMVLSTDPNHVIANFNRGVMLANAGRTEEAIGQFEKSMSLALPTDPLRERSEQWLNTLRSN